MFQVTRSLLLVYQLDTNKCIPRKGGIQYMTTKITLECIYNTKTKKEMFEHEK